MALKGRSVRPCNWHLWNNSWLNWQLPTNAAVVLIHAINPFGYAWRRRFNENNVDINRNFLLAEEAYVGAASAGRAISQRVEALATTSPLWILEPHEWSCWACDMGRIRFGRHCPSDNTTIPIGCSSGAPGLRSRFTHSQSFLPSVLDEAEEVSHLDFHTGLGSWAEGELLVSESEGIENCKWWRDHFGDDNVTQLKSFTKSYEVRGRLWAMAPCTFSRNVNITTPPPNLAPIPHFE